MNMEPRRPLLMLVASPASCRMPFLETIDQAVEGGVDLIQLRDKELSEAEMFFTARPVRELLRGRARLLVNGSADLALECGADGVHLPENGIPPSQARRILGPDAWIGQSVHSAAAAARAEKDGADYLVLGTIYPTPSKPGTPGSGPGLIAETAAQVGIDLLAIGGISEKNIPMAIGAGASGIAVCSAILDSNDPLDAARRLRQALDDAWNRGGTAAANGINTLLAASSAEGR